MCIRHKSVISITHAHALLELSKLGYSDLYEAGATPFKIKVKILRKSQDFGAYDYGHTFKYNYSFYNQIEYMSNPAKKRGCVQHVRYLI